MVAIRCHDVLPRFWSPWIRSNTDSTRLSESFSCRTLAHTREDAFNDHTLMKIMQHERRARSFIFVRSIKPILSNNALMNLLHHGQFLGRQDVIVYRHGLPVLSKIVVGWNDSILSISKIQASDIRDFN